MNVNDLKDRVAILQETITRDEEMNTVKTYRPLKIVWANVRLKQSKYAQTATGHKGSRQYIITMRYDALLFLQVCRLLYDNAVLEPISAPYNDGNKFMVIDCVETVPVPIGD